VNDEFSEFDTFEEEKPELFGPALAAYETARECLFGSLGIMAELAEKGVNVTAPDGGEIPPEYQARLAELEARLKEATPELEKAAREKNAAGGTARASLRPGVRV
jgi:hypothetical protein